MLKDSLAGNSSGRKLMILIFITIGSLLFTAIFSYLIVILFWGQGIIGQISNPDTSDIGAITALKVMQLINSIGGILIPALVFLWLADADFYTCRKRSALVNLRNSLFTIVLIFTIQPFIGLLSDWNEMMKLPHALAWLEAKMKAMEDSAMTITKAFVSATSISGLFFNLILMALIPAISEELMFRAALGRLLQKMTGSIHWAAIISALIFSAFHMQFFGFVPRFILGLGLSYLYFLSGNIWLPILAHFINNGFTVIAAYLFQNGYSNIDPEKAGTFDSVFPGLISMILTIILLFIFKKLNRQHGASE